MELIRKNRDFISLLGLCIVLYFIFFHNIGTYPLMDTDETRYASMAHDMFRTQDFMTLYLNGEYFFEKPPLYFWLECLSFKFFGVVNEFTVRFPVALLGFLSSLLMFFMGKRIVNQRYGVVSALILATSLEFVILSKFAILDIVLAFCVGFSIYFGFMTFFCEEKNKKYFWWLFYLFMGLSVLAKGIPGIALPVGTMFFASIFAKKFKEIFKPIFILPGAVIFLLIALPWHIVMLNIHNPEFFNEYIMKHHVARFINSQDLGRKQPFYFFILTILWGFFPWIVSCLATSYIWVKKLFLAIKNKIVFENLNNSQKYLYLNAISAVWIFIFFSASSTKLVTYILPIYFMLACLTAFLWIEYFDGEEYKKPINISGYILAIVLGLAGFIAIFAKFFLPEQLYFDIKDMQPFCVALLCLFAVFSILSIKQKNKEGLFKVTVALIMFLSSFGTGGFFNVDYKFGQNDLIQFAKQAKTEGKQLASFGFGCRYSLNYYYQSHVIYETDFDFEHLKELLADKNNMIIIKNKDFDTINENVKIKTVEKGRKYSTIEVSEE